MAEGNVILCEFMQRSSKAKVKSKHAKKLGIGKVVLETAAGAIGENGF